MIYILTYIYVRCAVVYICYIYDGPEEHAAATSTQTFSYTVDK